MSRIGPPEPGSVALETRRSVADVLWVANTRHGPGGHWFARVTHDDGDHDHLGSAGDAVRYLADHRVELPAEPPSADDLASLAAIREMVRGLLDPAAGWTAGVLAIMARASYRVDEAGRITATGAGWSAFLGDLLPPLLEVVRRRDRSGDLRQPGLPSRVHRRVPERHAPMVRRRRLRQPRPRAAAPASATGERDRRSPAELAPSPTPPPATPGRGRTGVAPRRSSRPRSRRTRRRRPRRCRRSRCRAGGRARSR